MSHHALRRACDFLLECLLIVLSLDKASSIYAQQIVASWKSKLSLDVESRSDIFWRHTHFLQLLASFQKIDVAVNQKNEVG